MNTQSTSGLMKDGEEPTEVLLALVSSPLITLLKRGSARIMTGKDKEQKKVVMIILNDVDWDSTVGIVGSQQKESE